MSVPGRALRITTTRQRTVQSLAVIGAGYFTVRGSRTSRTCGRCATRVRLAHANPHRQRRGEAGRDVGARSEANFLSLRGQHDTGPGAATDSRALGRAVL